MKPLTIMYRGKPKNLVIPTQAVLRAGDWDDKVAFHPACESVFKGQSEVFNLLVDLISKQLFVNAGVYAVEILSLATNTTEIPKLKAKQLELLSKIGDVKPTSLKHLTAILKRCTGPYGERPMLTVRLKRGDTVDGVKYSRTCRINRSMTNGPSPLLGAKEAYSEANGIAVRALFEEIIIPEEFVSFTNTECAPNLQVLLECYYKYATYLNSLRELLGKYKGATRFINTEWYGSFDAIADYKRYIPQELAGNIGTGKGDEQPQPAKATEELSKVKLPKQIATEPSVDELRESLTRQHIPAPVAPPAPAYPQQPAPVHTPAPAPAPAAPQSRGVTAEELLAARRNPHIHQPQHHYAPPGSYPPPQQPYPVPQYPQPQHYVQQPYQPQPQYPQPHYPPQPYQQPYAPMPQDMVYRRNFGYQPR